MINRLLLGGSVTVIGIGLSASAIVATRAPRIEGDVRQTVPAENQIRVDRDSRRIEPAAEAGFLGVAVTLQSVELSAKFDGTLERLDVHVGDHVKGGTSIAQLDARSVARDLEMAEAALRVAEAEHDRLGIELADASAKSARLHGIPELVPQEQIVTADSLEQVATARRRASAADLAGKRARIDQLKQMLKDAHIVAPFDGTIAARYVESGTTVSRSTPIVRVISPASLVIRFAVPEDAAAGVAVGGKVIVRVASMDLTADGVIASIAPEIDATLRMVIVEARLDARNGLAQAIPSGATARVLLP